MIHADIERYMYLDQHCFWSHSILIGFYTGLIRDVITYILYVYRL